MRPYWLGYVLPLACLVPTSAQAQSGTQTITDGYVTFGYGANFMHESPTGTDLTVDGLTGDGAIAFGIDGNVGTQIDVDLTELASDAQRFRDKIVAAPTVHLFWRNDEYLIGGFAGLIHCNYMDLVGLGGEAHYFLNGRTTLAFVASYAEPTRLQDAIIRGLTSVQAEIRYFVMDDLRLEASINYMNAYMTNYRVTDFWHMGNWGFGLAGEYIVPNTSLAVTLGWEKTRTANYFGRYDIDGDTLKVGLRWTFDHDLLARDRRGASLGNVGKNFGGLFGRVLGSGELGRNGYGYSVVVDDSDDDDEDE